MTPDEIFTAAYAKSRKNQPGITTTPSENLATFNRVWPVFWTIAARVNPAFFGRTQLIPYNVPLGGWPRPSDAESIYLIEEDGEDVAIVPFDERDADPFTPGVYEWGQVFFSAGNPLDPQGTESIAESVLEGLDFWYSRKAPIPTTSSEELSSLFPENFFELIVLELAMVFAHKDERTEEIVRLKPDRDAWLRLYVAHLEHATTGVRRSTGAAQRFTAQTYMPLNALLTGGSAVEL